MRIYDPTTGKILESGLTLAEANASIERRIREHCADRWKPENIEALVDKWKRTGFHPYNFAIEAEVKCKIDGPQRRKRSR